MHRLARLTADLARFGAYGLFNSMISWAIILGLDFSKLVSPALANTCGFAIGLMISFVLNRRLFDSERTTAEAIRFFTAAGVAFAANQSVLCVAGHVLAATPMGRLVAQGLSVLTYSASLFTLLRFWVFRQGGGRISKARLVAP